MKTGWTLQPALAERIATLTEPCLAVAADDLVRCVYPLRDRERDWSVKALPLWSSALYVALDHAHRCLYTGIVQRGTDEGSNSKAIRVRISEHYRCNQPRQTRSTWFYLWVVPLQYGVPRKDLEKWETILRWATASPQTCKSRLLYPAS